MVALCVVWCTLEKGYKYIFGNVPALMSAEKETWARSTSSQEMVALKDMVFIQETSAEKDRGKNMSLLQDFWLHATTGNLQGKLCGATRVIQWWKRLFNSPACGWKHSMAHPALPCVQPDSSSATGASLSPPGLLLLAPTQLSTMHGAGHATSMSSPHLDPLAPLSLSP